MGCSSNITLALVIDSFLNLRNWSFLPKNLELLKGTHLLQIVRLINSRLLNMMGSLAPNLDFRNALAIDIHVVSVKIDNLLGLKIRITSLVE